MTEVGLQLDVTKLEADTASPGEDEIYGDGGDDIILADHGIITQVGGTERLLTTRRLSSRLWSPASPKIS